MQRLFLMFPAGLPGLALMLLRTSVALALLAESFDQGTALSGWIKAAAIAAAAILFVGSWTPILAVASLLFHAAIWFRFGLDGAAAGIVTLDATALAMLGPGAYSLDSYRFGRRVVLRPTP
jgi:putative oxidoreductase